MVVYQFSLSCQSLYETAVLMSIKVIVVTQHVGAFIRCFECLISDAQFQLQSNLICPDSSSVYLRWWLCYHPLWSKPVKMGHGFA